MPHGVQPDVQHVALRHDQLLVAQALLDHVVAVELIENVAGGREPWIGQHRVHQVQLVDLEAIIAQRQRVGVALQVERARGVQQEVADRLVVVRMAQDAGQGRVLDPVPPVLVVQPPVIAGAHRHGLRIGRDACLDHRRLRREPDRIIAALPPVRALADTGRQPASGDRQKPWAGVIVAFTPTHELVGNARQPAASAHSCFAGSVPMSWSG